VSTEQPRTRRVLVVEDDELLRGLARAALEPNGWAVTEAASAEQAVELLRHESFDIGLIDLGLPGMDGIELIKQIRSDSDHDPLVLIVCTSSRSPDDTVDALEAGADDYVTKPYDPAVLIARARAQLRNRGAKAPAAVVGSLIRLRPGELISGKYRLTEPIGQGGQGEIWAAHHVQLERDVAVKFLRSAGTARHTREDSTRKEGVHASRVEHPGAVAVFDFDWADDGRPYLVMERLRGRELRDRIAEGPVSPAEATATFAPIAAALAAAHEAGVLHRDVKPGNIFLHEGPDGTQPKLLDFGIAEAVGTPVPTDQPVGTLAGTLHYVAPELVRGMPAEPATDLYALGATLFHALAGRPPFQEPDSRKQTVLFRHLAAPPPSLPDFVPSIPPALVELTEGLLAKEAAHRPTAADAHRRLSDMADLLNPG